MMTRMLVIFGILAVLPGFALAQDNSAAARPPVSRPPVSQCQLVAKQLPGARFSHVEYASARPDKGPLHLAALAENVTITFLGHSTFEIETPQGLTIDTDYSGYLRSARTPDVVTMNKAHSSHYTLSPDSGIAQVLHGWNDAQPGEPVHHNLVVGDAYIRNVATDIRSWGGDFEPNGNSIFIFEVAGLCIGHLGHLHHELTDKQFAAIGRLDVVMVPVDGGLTLGSDSMSRMVKRLRSALILPMHRRGPIVNDFVGLFGPGFDVRIVETNAVTVSMRSLPKKPLILVLSGF
ncbi:MBL fold metallo-hydrolase [Allorhizobium ampelinum]|uniref:MBL fold metallo-hydrolase n=1 Tax=Allorhizobium ampelinum TaxID=3025782 RepID=UPI001F2B5177|nr:MBL fold metallo-hydrolase [Allorhizobium ampelinum]